MARLARLGAETNLLQQLSFHVDPSSIMNQLAVSDLWNDFAVSVVLCETKGELRALCQGNL